MQIVNKVGGANYRKEEKTIFSLSLSRVARQFVNFIECNFRYSFISLCKIFPSFAITACLRVNHIAT